MRIKKTLCALLAAAMLLSLAACNDAEPTTSSDGGGTVSTADDGGSADGETPKEKIVFTWMLSTQQSIPFSDTKVYEAVTEKLNIDFELTELPPDQHMEQIKLKLASRQIPDLITFIDASVANQYGPEGAFVELSQYLDQMPNLRQKLDDNSAFKYNAYDMNDDLWFTPAYYSEPVPIFDFSYNKSAFDAVGATELDTWDQVYNALKAIKEQNPENYPLGFRSLGYSEFMNLFIVSFTEAKANANNIGFDYDTDQFIFCLEADGYKDAIAFFAKLYQEGLVDPEYTVMDQTALQDKVRDGKVVMMADYMGGWTSYPEIMSYVNDVLVPLPTPQAEGKDRVIGSQPAKLGNRGTALSSAVEGDAAKLERALEFFNWMYSEEEFNTMWNHPDVAEEVEDGVYKYKDIVYDTSADDYGIMKDTYFPWCMLWFQDKPDERPVPGSVYEQYKTNWLVARTDLYRESPVVPLETEQQERINILNNQVLDRFNAAIFDFMEGKRSMDEWESFVQELNDAGAAEMVSIYNEQYAKFK